MLLNVAISPKDQPITFYANLDRNFWGTTSPNRVKESDRSFGTRSVEMTVKGRRFESILEEFGVPYYLKVDIEGADLLCVKALKQFDTKPQFISIESTKASWSDLIEELDLLKELGYQKFKAVNQAKELSIIRYPLSLRFIVKNLVQSCFKIMSWGFFDRNPVLNVPKNG